MYSCDSYASMKLLKKMCMSNSMAYNNKALQVHLEIVPAKQFQRVHIWFNGKNTHIFIYCSCL